MLTKELARTIVSKLIAVLGKNINLMDQKGYIIASGDSSRVGTFHEGAAQVILEKRPLQVNLSDMALLSGVRHGINLPITFKNQVVGVVGITGDPGEVQGFGELVRYAVEMMLEQAALREEVHMQERAKDIFFQDLLSGNWGDEKLFIQRGTLLGMDLAQPKLAVVLELQKEEALYQQGEEALSESLLGQRALSSVMAALQAFFVKTGEILGAVGTSRLVLLLSVDPTCCAMQQRRQLENKIEQMRQSLYKNEKVLFTIGVGRFHSGLEGLKLSYHEGLDALELGQRFVPGSFVYYIADLHLESIVSEVPTRKKKAYYLEIIGTIVSNVDEDDYLNQLLETMEVYFAEGLSVKNASERLYVHRNTLMHRIKKIHMLTGLNPASFTDAFKLKLALLFYRSYQEV